MSKAPTSPLKPYYQQLNHLSAALAVATDFSLALLGGSLKRRESLSARLGDVLSHLYLASSTLRHYAHADQKDDLILAEWACKESIYQAQQAFVHLLNNLPNRPVAWLLRRIIFPLGIRYTLPDDQLTHALSALVLQTSPSRDRLIHGIYNPADVKQVLGQLEQAFRLCIDAEAIEKKLRKSAHQSAQVALENGLITEEEYQLVINARIARRQVIDVDHFTAQLEEDA